jgi:hypothetical protein
MTIDAMTSNYAAPLLRAFRQAPWRTQTQAMAAWSVILLTTLVLGGLYLQVAARAATAGRDLQALEARKTAILQGNDELRATLADLRAVPRLAARAEALGFHPAEPEQIEYLPVHEFPRVEAPTPIRAAAAAPIPANTLDQLGQWLLHTLQGLVTVIRTTAQPTGGPAGGAS